MQTETFRALRSSSRYQPEYMPPLEHLQALPDSLLDSWAVSVGDVRSLRLVRKKRGQHERNIWTQ